LFSEWISTRDESMSSTTGALPVVADERRHTSARTSAIASHSPANVAASMARSVRYSVESEGTDPNSRCWARRCSMSEHASPPPASISIACTRTLPRS
jgi:hypothetical protein